MTPSHKFCPRGNPSNPQSSFNLTLWTWFMALWMLTHPSDQTTDITLNSFPSLVMIQVGLY